MKKHIIIYSVGIANELVRRGYPIAKLKINKANKNRTIILFDDTEELRNELANNFNIRIQ